MANVRSGNTYYIDTQFSTNEELAVKNLRVLGVIVTVTVAGGQVVLTDSGTKKLDLRVATDEQSEFFDFSQAPILFATSIRPTTLTNAIVTCIIEESRG